MTRLVEVGSSLRGQTSQLVGQAGSENQMGDPAHPLARGSCGSFTVDE